MNNDFVSVKGKKKPNGKKSVSKRRPRDSKKLLADGTCWSAQSGSIPGMKAPQPEPNTYRIHQMLEGAPLLTTGVTPQFGEIGVTLSTLTDASTLEGLFDQYRIPLVEVWLIPSLETAADLTNVYVSCIDYNDANALSSVASGMNFDTAVVSNLSQGQYRCFVPHIAIAAYAGAFTSFANETAPWIDTGSPSVVHYGLKVAAEATVNATVLRYMARIHFEFKNVI